MSNPTSSQNNTNVEKQETSWGKIIGIVLGTIILTVVVIGYVVYSQLQSSRSRANDAKRETDIGQLQTSIAIYKNTEGEYPSQLADLKTVDALQQVPSDPDTNQPYAYQRTKNGSGYCLGGCMTGDSAPENSDNQ